MIGDVTMLQLRGPRHIRAQKLRLRSVSFALLCLILQHPILIQLLHTRSVLAGATVVVYDNCRSGNRYPVVYVGQCGSGRRLHCSKKLARVPVANWRGLGSGALTSCHYSTALRTPQRSGYHYNRCRSRRHW